MNYAKDTQALIKVTISDSSPRQSGETANRSEWTEIKQLPRTYQERIALINSLVAEGREVWFRTATTYGRARIFVKKMTAQ